MASFQFLIWNIKCCQTCTRVYFYVDVCDVFNAHFFHNHSYPLAGLPYECAYIVLVSHGTSVLRKTQPPLTPFKNLTLVYIVCLAESLALSECASHRTSCTRANDRLECAKGTNIHIYVYTFYNICTYIIYIFIKSCYISRFIYIFTLNYTSI